MQLSLLPIVGICMSIRQAEIWMVEFFPQAGKEIAKQRPAVVISHNNIGRLPLKTVVPITDWKSKYEHFLWMISLSPNDLNGLTKKSAIDCFQVKNFDDSRFVRKIGLIDRSILLQIHQTVLKTFDPIYSICK